MAENEQHTDPHGECAAEIARRLEAINARVDVTGYVSIGHAISDVKGLRSLLRQAQAREAVMREALRNARAALINANGGRECCFPLYDNAIDHIDFALSHPALEGKT